MSVINLNERSLHYRLYVINKLRGKMRLKFFIVNLLTINVICLLIMMFYIPLYQYSCSDFYVKVIMNVD
ncbi:hypothetical protein XCR1_790005 [Xenorhabdus cabanillasii JM26]|uniref:Uncharacterized protein n=1 Tax=Xenorhabdus cabanillasii JM26 TaxID=1427517 RepID=W1JA20_9GAMM|nr:hypothetical protein XCR1_790005 [Xenorhabdus cabanillasii JM26]